jgi:pectinesterase inhibitor-like protein
MTILPFLMFLFVLFLSILSNTSQFTIDNAKDDLKEACSVTQYKTLCIHTLKHFADEAGRSPSKWARAAVSVTIGEVKSVQAYILKLKSNKKIKGRNRVAILDCEELFGYALDELHKSLGLLRRLTKTTFGTQIGDLETWISAAITDQQTCVDGFELESKTEKKIKLLQKKVQNVSYITSNALALVNNLAASGIGSITDPEKL